MESPQSVVSPFKNLTVSGSELEKPRSEAFNHSAANISDINVKKGLKEHSSKNSIGVLNVYIHQARDIHNICIYHKQDVYAKLYLTCDPENTVSTQIINGGGKNPVFNDNIQLSVSTIDSSLKCEIWMLSRVRNYLEDQLLGFALVPLSEVLIQNGKIEKEFSLSSNDLFHSPAGFVQLSLSYSGASPEVIVIPKPSRAVSNVAQESEAVDSAQSDFDKIVFPDPKIATEDQMMVSEYIGITCDSVDSQNTESLISSDSESHELGVRVVESFSANSEESKLIPGVDSPPTSISTDGSPFVCLPTSSQSSEAAVTSKSPSQEHVSSLKDSKKGVGEGESEASNNHGPSKETVIKPLVTVDIEPEEKVVQQDIVDMYLKSMQQFTESLAKMKLPFDLDPNFANQAKSDNSESDQKSDQKSETPKSTGSRVFYGSRAFF